MTNRNFQGVFIRRIKNHQFRKLFLKNWLWVVTCIILPLTICACAIQYYSKLSLLREMDAAAYRSVRNTNATLQALLDEVCDTLEKEIINDDIVAFFEMEKELPVNYEFVVRVKQIQERVDIDMRASLYDSVDVYSGNSDFIISSKYRGQSYKLMADQSIVSAFRDYIEKYPSRKMFAVLRTTDLSGEEKVITVYWTREAGVDSFVSISIDTQKLIHHITDEYDETQGIYLIVDDEDQVVLDTSGQLNDRILEWEDANESVSSFTTEIDGKTMRLSWIEMETFGWKCAQMISMEDYLASNMRLQHTIMLIVLVGMIAGIILSYVVTVKLFRPVEAILILLENPAEQKIMDTDEEIQFVLFRILELFQKNITLENEMMERLFALRRARAKALQEQMTPHFLCNALQTINWIAIAETGEEDGATSQALILLADIIRKSKEQKYSLTSVEKEIDYIRKFIELERLRFGKGIICHYRIDSDVQHRMIPAISLQTLVENSITHGFRGQGGQGNIYINIENSEKNELLIRVEDDGVGISQEKIEGLFEQLQMDYIYTVEHVGLINLFQRFRLIYGDSCRFNIRQSNYGGVCVEIIAPQVSSEWMRIIEGDKENACTM